MQIAQIAPLSFLLLRWLFPKHVTFVKAIYIILGIGTNKITSKYVMEKKVKFHNKILNIKHKKVKFKTNLIKYDDNFAGFFEKNELYQINIAFFNFILRVISNIFKRELNF